MSIESKHAYRFGFLKSEQWQTLRLICIATDEGKCVICGKYDESNDAHHLFYRHPWSLTKVDDLLTLCRKCHKDVHDLGADILVRNLWEKYKYLFKHTPEAEHCRICKSTTSQDLIPIPLKANKPLMGCRPCVEVFTHQFNKTGNPWKAYEAAKDIVKKAEIRKFRAGGLRNFVLLGMEKQSDRTRFAKAVIRAGL